MAKNIYLLGFVLLLFVLILAPDALAAQTQNFATGQNAQNLDNAFNSIGALVKKVALSLLAIGIVVAAVMWAVGKLEWLGYIVGATLIISVGGWFVGGMMDAANAGAGVTAIEYLKQSIVITKLK